MEAFDKRELQGALRGDSLIGRGELHLDSAQLGAAPQRKVPGEPPSTKKRLRFFTDLYGISMCNMDQYGNYRQSI